MLFSIFALATSMMWFPEPSVPSEQAQNFLKMEINYLSANWSWVKILMTAIVPLIFILLGVAFWRKKALWGFIVLMVSIVIKMLWSVVEGGDSGYVLFPAAILGILVSGILIYIGRKKDWI